MKTTTGPEGIRVTVKVGEALEGEGRSPTRYASALRRKAANRARKSRGIDLLPEVLAGRCPPCAGWGVIGSNRIPCPDCGGDGG